MQCMIVSLIQVLTIQILIAAETNGQGLKNTRITLQCNDYKLIEIFKQIEDKTNYVFAYPDEIRKNEKRFSYNFKNETLENILKDLSEEGGIKFRVVETTITAALDNDLKAESKPREPVLVEVTVTGIVSDENRMALPGVNILVKGTTTGTTTNSGGKIYDFCARRKCRPGIFIYRIYFEGSNCWKSDHHQYYAGR